MAHWRGSQTVFGVVFLAALSTYTGRSSTGGTFSEGHSRCAIFVDEILHYANPIAFTYMDGVDVPG